MKKSSYALLVVLLFVVVLSSSCAGNGATPTPGMGSTQPPAIQPTSTDLPAPTATAMPTAAPQPIPCTIAFESDREGNWEIFSIAPDGSALTNLSNDPGEDSNPAWSPDGNQVAFVSNRITGGDDGQFIYIMDADGGNLRQLTRENGSKSPDWSHDGKLITYTVQGDIYSINADGSAPAVKLTNSPDEDVQPTWSPDGTHIAWLSGVQGNWNLFVMDPDGGNQLKISHNGRVESVQWTIDGQLFSIWNHPEGVCFKCVMNADGSDIKEAGGKGELQRFLPFRTRNENRVECISGENILSPDSEIYLVSESYDGIFLNLTNHPANDRNPDWPANCLSGFEGTVFDGASDSEGESTKPQSEMVFGYAGDKPEQKERAGAMQSACDELGVQCVYGEIPDLIDKGVDAIIQNSDQNSASGLMENILKAKDAAIPVFLLDAELNSDWAYSISINYDHWAKTSLGWMLEKIGGKGQIAYFDLDPARRYTETINDLLSRYPDVSVVDFRDGDYDPVKIKPETADFVNLYPDLKAIWTSYDNFQAMTGLEYLGIPYEKWPVMVCEATRDGLLTWERIQAAYPDFDCFASVNPPGIAYGAVYAAYYLESGIQIDESVLGGEFGRTLYVNLPTVTKDNFKQKLDEMLKEDTYLVDEWMSPDEIKENWFLE